MSIKVALQHRTTYGFAQPVTVGPHVVRLRPAPHTRTPIEAYSLSVTPANHFVNWQQDPFGNWLARLVFPEKTDRLEITVGLVADLVVINPFDFFIEEYAESFPFDYEPGLKADLAPYLRSVESSDEVDAWRRRLPAVPEDGVRTVEFLAGLNGAVNADVAYSMRMEPGVQAPDETLRRGVGSCRDSAWLLVALLRQHGLAARFVSGYLVQLAADQESLDGPSGPTEDFTDLHAWCEVYVPGAGWIGLDPTSALFAGEGHIPLSATPRPSSAAPIEGATDPVEVTFSFANEVTRIHQDPRVTRPCTEQEWARIDALGEAVDRRLQGVELTMGGELTFVSFDGQQDPYDREVTPEAERLHKVDVEPTATWAEQRELITTLYAQARQADLLAERFDLDGRHTGTGGGSHLTLGGTSPERSPLLRRPDLLASLIRYWQRHPSLSYLFSGSFVGPDSQAPRFDEGRPEAVYEMEIALQEVARIAREHPEPRPSMIDRALRHLLTDLTGSTQRAELCIDRLHSPDPSKGRRGLLELRGFEMPPHPQLALLQSLLVRSLVAWFWKEPYDAPLVRHGRALHEDFLLPHGCLRDIEEVVADLRRHGIPFESQWLAAYAELRFPRIGVTTVATGPMTGVELELRQGIEPWKLLSEEATETGSVRYVDSSVERIQVSARGIDLDRQLVTCQGVPVPLTPTFSGQELYAGVRFKAWSPRSSLHPSIDVQAPLRFDVVDIASQTSLGGATYHVVHPGGRSYDRPPVNANEAEARRASRFEARGHTSGRLDVAQMRERASRAMAPEAPHTLDLRRVAW